MVFLLMVFLPVIQQNTLDDRGVVKCSAVSLTLLDSLPAAHSTWFFYMASQSILVDFSIFNDQLQVVLMVFDNSDILQWVFAVD